MRKLDSQLLKFREHLIRNVKIPESSVDKVATIIASEIRFLKTTEKEAISAASPVGIDARWDELRAFQSWSDFALTQKSDPAITRTAIIAQNYICFVYLKDACFETVTKYVANGSVTHLCCTFLSSGNLRKFRNGFSHANWCYKEDFSGLRYWVRKNPREPDGELIEYEVSKEELAFWQCLARAAAIAIYEQLRTK
jgi:hypothetical protein